MDSYDCIESYTLDITESSINAKYFIGTDSLTFQITNPSRIDTLTFHKKKDTTGLFDGMISIEGANNPYCANNNMSFEFRRFFFSEGQKKFNIEIVAEAYSPQELYLTIGNHINHLGFGEIDRSYYGNNFGPYDSYGKVEYNYNSPNIYTSYHSLSPIDSIILYRDTDTTEYWKLL